MSALSLAGSHADASTCLEPGVPISPSYPAGVVPAFPANGLFHGQNQWARDGQTLDLSIDTARSAQLLTTVFVPTMPLAKGMVFVTAAQGYCAPPYSGAKSPCDDWRLAISDPDTVAPARPLVQVRTLLVKDPRDVCDVDKLELAIDTTDDTTERRELTLGAYIAPTAAEVENVSAFSVTFGYDPQDEDPTKSTIVLGESIGRKRDGVDFSAQGSFCFALASFDRSGNISERSATNCLDTTNESDLSVVWVESDGGCGCEVGARGGSGWAIVSAVALILRRRRVSRG